MIRLIGGASAWSRAWSAGDHDRPPASFSFTRRPARGPARSVRGTRQKPPRPSAESSKSSKSSYSGHATCISSPHRNSGIQHTLTNTAHARDSERKLASTAEARDSEQKLTSAGTSEHRESRPASSHQETHKPLIFVLFGARRRPGSSGSLPGVQSLGFIVYTPLREAISSQPRLAERQTMSENEVPDVP